MKKVKNIALASVFVGLVGCVAGGVCLNTPKTVQPHAEVTRDNFYVFGVGIRLIDDENGVGLRFQTRMSVELYNELTTANTVAKTGTLILPEFLSDGNLMVANTSALNVETTDLWTLTEDETERYSIAYVYDIPESNFGSKLVAVSYVEYTDGTVKYTTETPATSMTDVAKTASPDIADKVSAYIVDSVTVKYKDQNGASLKTETYEYGATLTPPEVTAPDGYYFDGWTMKNGTAWDFENWKAQGSTTLIAKYTKIPGKYVVAESAYDIGVDIRGTQFQKTEEIEPAKGFKNVYKYQMTPPSLDDNYIHGMNFNNVNLDNYSKVHFAIKTAQLNCNGKATLEINDWVQFTLTQTAPNTWSVVATYNGKTVYSEENLNGAYSTNANYSNNALDAILYGNPNGFSPFASEGDLIVYISELRGDPGAGYTLKENVQIADSVYELNTDLAGGTILTESTETAPEGFNKVYKFESTTASEIHGKNFDDTDLTEYETVTFGIKTASFNFNNETTKVTDDWMIFTLTQTSTATWNLVVTVNGEVIYSKTGLNGAHENNGVYCDNALDSILYGNPSGFYPTAKDGKLLVYVTEVCTVTSTNLEKVTATEKILTDATLTTETAPTGYSKVYKMTPKNTVSEGDGTELANVSTINISKYEKLTYKIKVAKSWVLFDGWAHYYSGNNQWQEVVVEKTASGWAVTFDGTTTVRTGDLLSDVLAFNMDKRYHTDCLPSEIYITELKGYVDITKPNELPEYTAPVGVKIAESVYDAGIDISGGQFVATTEIAPATGYENVYKYQSFANYIHGLNFSNKNLSNYSQVTFAMRTAKFNFNGETTQTFSGWLYFTLTQTAPKTWNLEVKYNGETVYTKTGLNGAYNTNEVYSDNALDAILYGNPFGFNPVDVDGTLTVYVTEIRGTANPTGANS